MPAEDAGRVFERFYRVDSARDRAHGGSGLGLSIVAAIVAAHGGTVSAQSVPGQGMTVTVRIPIIADAAEETEVADPPVSANGAGSPAGAEAPAAPGSPVPTESVSSDPS
jgi:hypothetical protein